LDRYLSEIGQRIKADDIKFVVLRLKRVRHPDVVCIERIEHFLREQTARGVTVLLAGVRPDTLAVAQNVGFPSWFPADHVFPEEDEEYSATLKAVRYARSKLVALEADVPLTKTAGYADHPGLYYLV
jgi:SulP family sulfate permease